MDCKEFLQRLSDTPGVSGYEDAVRQVVVDEFEKYADEVRIHKMGSAIALRRGQTPEPRHRILLAGHQDEIGMMVTKLEEGFLHIAMVGGIDARILPGQEVTVYGRKVLPGIVAARPPHVLTAADRDSVIPMDKLFVDVGLTKEELPNWVRVGDLVTFRPGFRSLENGWASGKALDDRVGVAVVAACLSNLADQWKHSWDVYGVATSQEEVTMIGALSSAYGIRPDIAIAIDVTFGSLSDSPEPGTFAMDGGPVIGFGPNVHPKVHELLVEAAKGLEMSHQIEPLPRGSGTDAWEMQVTRAGVPTGVLGVPLRYMHTPVETVSIRDIERAGRLLAAFIARLDDSTLEAFAPSLEAE